MKVLVAPTGPGDQPDDFHHAVPGELVTVPFQCSNPECGCDRAWVGATSRKATTTAVVADLPLTRAQYTRALDDSDRAAAGQPPRRFRLSRGARIRANDLARIAGHHDVGEVLERSGRNIEVR